MKEKVKLTFIRVLLSLAYLALLASFKPSPTLASAPTETIAYVLPNDETGDEIHFINADGTGDKKIWSTDKPGVVLTKEIHSLAWKPDASELAFMSKFQDGCSIYQEDVYAIRADGMGLRRQTAPYGCGPNPGLPTGTVVLDVVNYSETGVYFVYVEGAPAPQSVTLPSGGSITLTFTDVMDYGNGVDQWAAGIVGLYRYMDSRSSVDVIPGGIANATLRLSAFTPSWKSPTYSSDGQYMAYLASPNFPYYAPSPMTSPGGIGTYWQPDTKDMASSPSHLQWIGDTPEQSVLLYLGYKIFHDSGYGYGFYLADHTGSTLLTEVEGVVLGMAKLPDDTGLIYSMAKDMGTFDDGGCIVQWVGNIYQYDFASGNTTQLSQFTPRPRTDIGSCPPGPFPYELTISPDGSQIAFELQAEGSWMDVTHYLDLWIMNRDGADAHELVPGGQSPAWSPAEIPDLNPIPGLTGINPNLADAGGETFSLTASGSSFVNGSLVLWNGKALTTTYVDATTLTALVTADKITTAGTASVTIFTPGPGGGESTIKTFTINAAGPTNPVPSLTSLNPSAANAGGPDFALMVHGNNFVNDSVVRWNGVNLPTTYNDATSLTVQVTAEQIASTGSVSVTVFTPAPGGGESEALTLSIVNPEPVLAGLDPGQAVAGGTDFTLTISGSGFTKESVVRWNGVNLVTTYASPTMLTAQVSAAQIATAGTASVTIFNPAPNGGESEPKIITISNIVNNYPVPVLNSLNPISVSCGKTDFTLTVHGSNFVNLSVVRWNGLPLATTYVDTTTLTALVTADKIDTGTSVVTVFNPAPSGGESQPLTITVNELLQTVYLPLLIR